ncbi:MAG TPA: hypothetical protein VM328_10405 [Fimbriimonadaceae bacterium]|nr:hypothetical protein [Fimbriimonadaceae bacterium]
MDEIINRLGVSDDQARALRKLGAEAGNVDGPWNIERREWKDVPPEVASQLGQGSCDWPHQSEESPYRDESP